MKTIIRTAIIAMLVGSLGTPAFAQEPAPAASLPTLEQAIEKAQASSQIGVGQQFEGGTASGRALMWTGAALFVGGMGVGIYNFLNNQNGEFPEFGEATASNKKLGAAGIATAFAGGALMALGHKISRHSPDIQVGVDRFAVSKRVSW